MEHRSGISGDSGSRGGGLEAFNRSYSAGAHGGDHDDDLCCGYGLECLDRFLQAERGSGTRVRRTPGQVDS